MTDWREGDPPEEDLDSLDEGDIASRPLLVALSEPPPPPSDAVEALRILSIGSGRPAALEGEAVPASEPSRAFSRPVSVPPASPWVPPASSPAPAPSSPPAPRAELPADSPALAALEDLTDDAYTPPPTPAPPPVSIPPSELAADDFVEAPSSVPLAAPAVPPPAPPAARPRASNEPVARRRAKPWWDEVFQDDFARTMGKVSDPQIRREATFIAESLGIEPGGVVLDLACGTGRHAIELASRGYSMVGLDLSVAMLAQAADEAQSRGQRLNFLQGDMREMGFEDMFDGVYCWSTSFGYFEDDRNLAVAQRIHRSLRRGGMLLLDVVNRDFVAPRQPTLVWFEGEGCVCIDDTVVDFFSSRLRVKRTVMLDDGRTREVDYSIRLYGLHELGQLLRDAGFKVIEVSGHPATPGVFFGAESPRLIVLAEKV